MTPQSRALPVILTRPAAQGDRFAADLRAHFGEAVEVILSPLIAPVFPAVALPEGDFHAMILTSETGAQAAARLPGVPRRAWCVGDRTAAAARALGFDAQSAAGDADALVAAVLAAGESGPLIHLRGRDSRGEVAARLTAQGVPTAEVIVYAQVAQPLTGAAQAVLRGHDPVIVPLFSPRTAQLFAATQPAAPLFIAALSPAVLAGLGDLPCQMVTVADRPEAAALVQALVPLIAVARA
ncbi:MAG: uroporphyrinogen-III synthase [Rhodobacteraceae bacterium PARR1]|nr:MAG: uroporphyrinogen-III synthase [Rhodobacteraceae bacterium PARR1]